MYKIAINSFLPSTLPLTSLKTVGVYFLVRLKLGKDANQDKFEVAHKENIKCFKIQFLFSSSPTGFWSYVKEQRRDISARVFQSKFP